MLGRIKSEESSKPGLDTERGQFKPTSPSTEVIPDAKIETEIAAKIRNADSALASQIEVDVDRGEVTLRGTVDSRESKARLETLVESVSGIVDLHNQLRIQTPGFSSSPANPKEKEKVCRI